MQAVESRHQPPPGLIPPRGRRIIEPASGFAPAPSSQKSSRQQSAQSSAFSSRQQSARSSPFGSKRASPLSSPVEPSFVKPMSPDLIMSPEASTTTSPIEHSFNNPFATGSQHPIPFPEPPPIPRSKSKIPGLKGIFSKSKTNLTLVNEVNVDSVLDEARREEPAPPRKSSVTSQMTVKSRAASIKRPSRSKLKTPKKERPSKTTRPAMAWDPPPYFQATPQAIISGPLSTPIITVEAILRLAKLRSETDELETPEGETLEHNFAPTADAAAKYDKKKQKRQAAALESVDCVNKVCVLLTDGFLLQYSEDGSYDRLPEKIMQLNKDSTAFASDLLPGKHWVLQVNQSASENGAIVDLQKGTMFSKFNFWNDAKRRESTLFLVLNSPEDMDAWLVAIRREIHALGGQSYRPDEKLKGMEEQSLRRALTKGALFLVKKSPDQFSPVSSPTTPGFFTGRGGSLMPPQSACTLNGKPPPSPLRFGLVSVTNSEESPLPSPEPVIQKPAIALDSTNSAVRKRRQLSKAHLTINIKGESPQPTEAKPSEEESQVDPAKNSLEQRPEKPYNKCFSPSILEPANKAGQASPKRFSMPPSPLRHEFSGAGSARESIESYGSKRTSLVPSSLNHESRGHVVSGISRQETEDKRPSVASYDSYASSSFSSPIGTRHGHSRQHSNTTYTNSSDTASVHQFKSPNETDEDSVGRPGSVLADLPTPSRFSQQKRTSVTAVVNVPEIATTPPLEPPAESDCAVYISPHNSIRGSSKRPSMTHRRSSMESRSRTPPITTPSEVSPKTLPRVASLSSLKARRKSGADRDSRNSLFAVTPPHPPPSGQLPPLPPNVLPPLPSSQRSSVASPRSRSPERPNLPRLHTRPKSLQPKKPSPANSTTHSPAASVASAPFPAGGANSAISPSETIGSRLSTYSAASSRTPLSARDRRRSSNRGSVNEMGPPAAPPPSEPLPDLPPNAAATVAAAAATLDERPLSSPNDRLSTSRNIDKRLSSERPMSQRSGICKRLSVERTLSNRSLEKRLSMHSDQGEPRDTPSRADSAMTERRVPQEPEASVLVTEATETPSSRDGENTMRFVWPEGRNPRENMFMNSGGLSPPPNRAPPPPPLLSLPLKRQSSIPPDTPSIPETPMILATPLTPSFHNMIDQLPMPVMRDPAKALGGVTSNPTLQPPAPQHFPRKPEEPVRAPEPVEKPRIEESPRKESPKKKTVPQFEIGPENDAESQSEPEQQPEPQPQPVTRAASGGYSLLPSLDAKPFAPSHPAPRLEEMKTQESFSLTLDRLSFSGNGLMSEGWGQFLLEKLDSTQ